MAGNSSNRNLPLSPGFLATFQLQFFSFHFEIQLSEIRVTQILFFCNNPQEGRETQPFGCCLLAPGSELLQPQSRGVEGPGGPGRWALLLVKPASLTWPFLLQWEA